MNISENTFYSDDFEDYAGKHIELRWSEKLWLTHLYKHPEIINQATASNLIKEALTKPSLIITGFRPGDEKEMILCYYKEHKRHQSDIYYSKVVIGYRGKVMYVKTVFKGWALSMYVVQEKKYDFKELYRDEKTYL